MKLWVKLLMAAIPSFATGFAAGYFVRKKTCEVEIEEVSEEDLQNMLNQAQKTAEELAPKDEPEYDGAMKEAEKEAYFKRWKSYDTVSKDPPDDIMAISEEDLTIEPEDKNTEDETPDDEEEDEPEHEDISKNRPKIEAGSIEDWNHWSGLQDGEYDPTVLNWYSVDDVVCDEDDIPVEEPRKYIGFDIGEMFATVDSKTTGDRDVRVIFNHKLKAIYYLHRINTSFSRKKRQEEYGDDEYDEDEPSQDDIREWFGNR